ncbi:MAG: zinc-ribbon domain-containing protein [Deltaproteobacteria bacterium]|nr:zinc-ribbon domain-containing protein [Deltaproteobacteria bacterium]
MKFSCDSCGAQYMIADAKIGPKGVKVKCKKCAQVIVLRVGKKGEGSVPPDAKDAKSSSPAPAKANGRGGKTADEEFTVSLSTGQSQGATSAVLAELGTSSDLGVSTEFRAAGFDEDPVMNPKPARLPSVSLPNDTGSGLASPFQGGGVGGSLSDGFGVAGMTAKTGDDEPATRVDFDPMARGGTSEAPSMFGSAGTPSAESEDPSTNVAPGPEANESLGGFGAGLSDGNPFATAREMGAIDRPSPREASGASFDPSSEATVGFDASSEATVGALDQAFPSPPAKGPFDPTADGSVPHDDPSHAMGSREELESELGSAFDAVFGGVEPEPGMNDPFAMVAQAAGTPADKLPTRVLDTGSVDALAQKARVEPTVATPEPVEWFVAINDEQVGPLGFRDIQGHWDRGSVDANTLCWRAGMSDWVQVRFVPELEALGPMDGNTQLAADPGRAESARVSQSLRADTPPPAPSLASSPSAFESSLRASSPPPARSPGSRPAWEGGADLRTDQLDRTEPPAIAETAPLPDEPRPKLEIVPSVPPPSARPEPLGSVNVGLLGASAPTLGATPSFGGAVPEHPGDDEPSWRPSAASALASLAADEMSDTGKKKREGGFSGSSTLPPPSDALSSLLSEPSMTGLQAFKPQSDDSSTNLSPLPKAAPDVAAVSASRPAVGRRPNWVLIAAGGMGLVIVVLLLVLVFRSPPAPPPPVEKPVERPVELATVKPPPPAPTPVPPPVAAEPDAGVAPEPAQPVPELPAEPAKAAKKKERDPEPKKKAPSKAKPEPDEDEPPRRTPEPDVDSLDPDALLEGASRRTRRPVVEDSDAVPSQLAEDDILRELRKHKDEIRDCIEKQRRSDPRLEGKMTMKFVLLNSGRTSEHNVQPVKFDGSVLGKCIVDSVRKWRFPKFSGKPMPIEFPVSL